MRKLGVIAAVGLGYLILAPVAHTGNVRKAQGAGVPAFGGAKFAFSAYEHENGDRGRLTQGSFYTARIICVRVQGNSVLFVAQREQGEGSNYQTVLAVDNGPPVGGQSPDMIAFNGTATPQTCKPPSNVPGPLVPLGKGNIVVEDQSP